MPGRAAWSPFLLLAALALAVRMALLAATYGTNDVTTFATYADILEQRGAGALYAIDPGASWADFALCRNDPWFVFAHPPPMVGYIAVLAKLRALGVPFPIAFRLLASLADIATGAIVFGACRARGDRRALLKAGIVLLSPALVLVSAFHGNTDPLLVLFAVSAVLAAESERALLAGACVALACSVKLAGVIVVPAVFLTLPARRWPDAAIGFLSATAVAWGAALAVVPAGPALAQTFGYAATTTWWGFSALFRAGTWANPGPGLVSHALAVAGRAYFKSGKAVVLAIGALAVLARARRGARGAPLAASSALAFIALTPGFGPQYLAWPGALLALASARRGAIFAAVSGAFLLLAYREWSFGSLGYASSWAHGSWNRPLTDVVAYATWALALVGSVALAARRRP